MFTVSKSKWVEYEVAQKRIKTTISTTRTRYIQGAWLLDSVDPMGQAGKLLSSQSFAFRRDSAILRTANVYPSVRAAWNVRESI